MAENKEYKDIELRSEKVRNIIGKTPPVLLRIGIIVISLVICLTLALAYIIPYPDYKEVPVTLYSHPPVQTVNASSSGVFFSDIKSKSVKAGQKICMVKNESTDSIFNYYSEASGEVFINYKDNDYVEQGSIILSVIPNAVTSIYGICSIPADEIKSIEKGQKVTLMSAQQYSFSGYISEIYPIPEVNRIKEERYFKIEVYFNSDDNILHYEVLLPNVENTCRILISNEPILKKVLNRCKEN